MAPDATPATPAESPLLDFDLTDSERDYLGPGPDGTMRRVAAYRTVCNALGLTRFYAERGYGEREAHRLAMRDALLSTQRDTANTKRAVRAAGLRPRHVERIPVRLLRPMLRQRGIAIERARLQIAEPRRAESRPRERRDATRRGTTRGSPADDDGPESEPPGGERAGRVCACGCGRSLADKRAGALSYDASCRRRLSRARRATVRDERGLAALDRDAQRVKLAVGGVIVGRLDPEDAALLRARFAPARFCEMHQTAHLVGDGCPGCLALCAAWATTNGIEPARRRKPGPGGLRFARSAQPPECHSRYCREPAHPDSAFCTDHAAALQRPLERFPVVVSRDAEPRRFGAGELVGVAR